MNKPNLAPLINLPDLEPREFCSIYVARSPYEEEEWGYRSKCVRVLARVLHISEETVRHSWGAGLDFPKCPAWAKRQLRYLHLLAQQQSA